MKMMSQDQANKNLFFQVLEASIEELQTILLSQDTAIFSFELLYAEGLRAFLRGEIKELKKISELAKTNFSNHAEVELLEIALHLRLRIRERAFDLEILKQAQVLAKIQSRWQGELSILIATLFTIYEDFGSAKSWFEISSRLLDQVGCHRKALRARMNKLVCESHLDSTRNLLSEYHDLYRSSLKKDRRDLIVATTCLLNMSREYQLAGAHLAALKWCTKGLELCEFHFGSLNHHLLMVHRAHLLCELGRFAEARIDFEDARLSQFPEVQAALEVVRSLLDSRTTLKSENPNLLPTWKERSNEVQGERFQFSTLEDQLIKFLSKGPRDRVDVLEHLYGTALSYETKLNRFKSLLMGLRKKSPELVRYENDTYRLAEQILVPRKKRAE